MYRLAIGLSVLSIIYNEANEKINRLEAKLNEVVVQNSTLLDIKPIAEVAIKSLELLDKLYDDANVQGKRYLVGMLYPEKLTFDGVGCRTLKLNEGAQVIYLKNKELQAKKMGQKSFSKILPHKGWITVQNPHRFIDELIDVGHFSKIVTTQQ